MDFHTATRKPPVPRRGGAARCRVVVYATLALLLASALSWAIPVLLPADTKSAAAQSSCRVVQTISGEGNKQTAPFDIASSTWRIDYGFEANTKIKGASFLGVEVYREGNSNLPIDSISLENPGNDSSFENTKPGSYYLKITSANARWKVKVSDCGTPGATPTGAPAKTSAGPPANAPANVPTTPRNGLPKSGGPTLLLPAAALIVGSGLVALGISSERSRNRGQGSRRQRR